MLQSIIKITISFLLIINVVNSFELGFWRGITNYYIRTNNNFDLKKPLLTTYNYSHHFMYNRSLYNYNNIIDSRFFRLKLQSYDKLGGIIAKVDRHTDNTYYFTNQINFYYNSARSIITINYSYNNDLKMQLNSIIISGLRCGFSQILKNRTKLHNVSSLKNKLKNWSYCKSTTVNPRKPFSVTENEIDCYEYEYLLENENENRISYVFTDNLIISVPDIIDSNRPFSLLFGCLISNNCYKQVNLNYNFNGHLTSIEYNEYEPYNFNAKIIKLLNIMNVMKNKMISFK